jgi:hypothetical protein
MKRRGFACPGRTEIDKAGLLEWQGWLPRVIGLGANA